jgi:hypothetical protein
MWLSCLRLPGVARQPKAVRLQDQIMGVVKKFGSMVYADNVKGKVAPLRTQGDVAMQDLSLGFYMRNIGGKLSF